MKAIVATWLAGSAALTLVIAVACVGGDPTVTDAADASCDGCSEPTVPFDASCDGPSYDLRGCACPTRGKVELCHQGVPGPASACSMAGVQVCGADLVWGACSGGSFPSPEEACFDGVDNDCNGKIDENCRCSDDVDLCTPDGGLLNGQQYNFVFYPPAPKAGEPFEMYVLSKNPMNTPRSISLGGIGCQGSTEAPCVSAGRGCAGWGVSRWVLTLSATRTVEFFVGDDVPLDSPCAAAKSVATSTIVVTP